MIPDDWFPHRRADGEVVGFIAEDGDAFQPYDLLGRAHGEPCDWLTAEERLDALDLAWLGEPQLMVVDPSSAPRRIRILEVTRERLVVVDDEFGAAQGVPAAGRALRTWSFELPLTVSVRAL